MMKHIQVLMLVTSLLLINKSSIYNILRLSLSSEVYLDITYDQCFLIVLLEYFMHLR